MGFRGLGFRVQGYFGEIQNLPKASFMAWAAYPDSGWKRPGRRDSINRRVRVKGVGFRM